MHSCPIVSGGTTVTTQIVITITQDHHHQDRACVRHPPWNAAVSDRNANISHVLVAVRRVDTTAADLQGGRLDGCTRAD